MSTILTYNQIISELRSIASNHRQINSFDIGKDEDFAGSTKYIYPILFITPISGTFYKSEANDSYNSKDFTVELKVLNLVNKGLNNISDVYSDCEQIISDIVTEINENENYIENSVSINSDINFEALEQFSDEELSGFKTQITFRLKNKNSFCGLPFSSSTPIPAIPDGKILTYNQVLLVLKDIQERHFQLNTFGHGKDYNFATSLKPVYPAMYVQLSNGTYPKSEISGSYPSKSFFINLKVLDLVNKSTDNQDDAHSDTFQMISDIITEINEHSFYQLGFLTLVGDINLDPLEEWSDEEVSGWACTLEFKLKKPTNYCSLPIS